MKLCHKSLKFSSGNQNAQKMQKGVKIKPLFIKYQLLTKINY